MSIGFDEIKTGDRVTISNRFDQTFKGRVVMKGSVPGTWVLNMGGKYGTPGIATEKNFVSATKGKKRGGMFG